MVNFMKKLFLALLLVPVFAQAEQGLYYGFDATRLNLDVKVLDTDAQLNALRGRIGFFFCDYFALEGQIGLYSTPDNGFRSKYGSAWYARPNLPIGEKWDVYGLLGYGTGVVETEVFNQTVVKSSTTVKYGAGVEVEPFESHHFFAEYQVFTNTGDIRVDGFSIGWRKEFNGF